jgi:hypothetical protein
MTLEKGKIQILGAGYCGDRLGKYMVDSCGVDKVIKTRTENGPTVKRFVLGDRMTWTNLEPADVSYWLFPAEPLNLVKEFLSEKKGQLGRVIVVGSTSGFLVQAPDGVVSESSPLNSDIERVRGEEAIRELGGIVVRAAGIYGPSRNPRAWLRKGMIVAGSTYLNLIHVDDLVQILAKAAAAEAGLHFLAADGQPKRWYELSDRWIDIPLKAEFNRDLKKEDSKIVDSSWTLKTLNVTLRYPSIFEGIESLYE